MGPVSFEALDGGATRSEALSAASRLRAAGIRVQSVVTREGGEEVRYQLIVQSADSARARHLLASVGREGEQDRTGR